MYVIDAASVLGNIEGVFDARAEAYGGMPEVCETMLQIGGFLSEKWKNPFICCFSDGDPITRGLYLEFKRRVLGAQGQPHAVLHGGHFSQEDASAFTSNKVLKTSHFKNVLSVH